MTHNTQDKDEILPCPFCGHNVRKAIGKGFRIKHGIHGCILDRRTFSRIIWNKRFCPADRKVN